MGGSPHVRRSRQEKNRGFGASEAPDSGHSGLTGRFEAVSRMRQSATLTRRVISVSHEHNINDKYCLTRGPTWTLKGHTSDSYRRRRSPVRPSTARCAQPGATPLSCVGVGPDLGGRFSNEGRIVVRPRPITVGILIFGPCSTGAGPKISSRCDSR